VSTVPDRLYYRLLPDGAGWNICLSSPESGFLDQCVFDLPSDEELKRLTRAELGTMFAHHLAVGAAMGFKHGVIVGSLVHPNAVDPDLGRTRDMAADAGPERCAALYAKRPQELREDEQAGYGAPHYVDWTSQSHPLSESEALRVQALRRSPLQRPGP
jgi:hypothetical protein